MWREPCLRTSPPSLLLFSFFWVWVGKVGLITDDPTGLIVRGPLPFNWEPFNCFFPCFCLLRSPQCLHLNTNWFLTGLELHHRSDFGTGAQGKVGTNLRKDYTGSSFPKRQTDGTGKNRRLSCLFRKQIAGRWAWCPVIFCAVSNTMPAAIILWPIMLPLKFPLKSKVAIFAIPVCKALELLRKGNYDNFQICYLDWFRAIISLQNLVDH